MSQSEIIVLSHGDALCVQAGKILAPAGWRCEPVAEAGRGLALIEERAPAALLIDAEAPGAAALIEGTRRLAAPLNGTPILIAGDAEAAGVAPQGAGGIVPAPLTDASFEEALRRWAGPLADHAFRAMPPQPRYRLTRLLGLDNADAMLGRFRITLEEALANGPAASAHQLAGSAGMLGFAQLSECWASVDRGESGALPRALVATRRALTEIG